MPRIYAEVHIEDFFAALDISLANLPTDALKKIRASEYVDMKVFVDQDDIDGAASEPNGPDIITADAEDLREAVRSLLVGDLSIASVMFARALKDDEAAAQAVEEEIRASVSRRRPNTLARAA